LPPALIQASISLEDLIMRRPLVLPLIASAILAGLLASPVSVRADDDAQPAKKDSAKALKSTHATLSASVEPAQAKPGDVVTFKVTAKLDSGYHIYKYSKERGNGPVPTSFDFFGRAGFELDGEWTASRDPEKHKDPNFPDVDSVEYYEDEVTWSIKLKVPATAAPGKKSLRCQARYMICDAKTCSIPGNWTLPDVELTVIDGDAAQPASAKLAAPEPPAARPVQALPAKKDSNPAIRPPQASFTTAIEPAQAKLGDIVTYKVTAKLEPGYHIYQYAKNPGPGPIATSFDFFDRQGLEPGGDWTASRPPIKHKDPGFEEVPFVEYFEDEVTWSVKLKVPAGGAPGKRTLRCQVYYQVCNASTCSQDVYVTLPEAELTVLAGTKASPAIASPAIASPAIASPAPAPAQAGGDSAGRPASTPVSSPPSPFDSTPAKEGSSPKASPPQAPASSAPVVQSEIAQQARAGLIPFLIASAIGGLFALVMPCVWPMVPITVNFFIKQGQGASGRKKATGLAFIYCLSIIGVFTSVGVLFSFFFSASSLQNLANNPWLNLFVAGLFVVFGLSLLGLFDLRLPSFLLNASANNEGRGGLIGVFFMALTLTITSFTCTFPVVGGLLVMAAGGDFFYPIVGLATFSAVLAFPFLLLALSPGLISKMPRSGDWMNAVKVVGGLVEIGAALKFINTAELARVVPEDAWFDAAVILTCWIALSLVCGLYLLGIFRTDHDHGDVKVGTGRIIFGAAFLGLAIYMAPALFGRPPQSLVWDRLIVGILPPDASEFYPHAPLSGAGAETSAVASHEVKATSKDPAQAEKEEKKLHGVLWGMSFDQAREQAAAEHRPILIDFTGVNCANCRLMERRVLPKPEVVSLLKKFVTVQLYTDFVPISSITPDAREELAGANQVRLLKLAKEATNPFYVVLTPEGEVLGRMGGYNDPPIFVDFLNKALDRFPAVTNTDTKNSQPRAENSRREPPGDAKATSNDPTRAEREEKTVHGVVWGLSFDQAREQAAAAKLPILIEFTGVNCANCRLMERRVLPRPEVVSLLKKFVTVQLYTDFVPISSIKPDERRELARANQVRLRKLNKDVSIPFYVVLTPEGEVLGRMSGYKDPPVFVDSLNKALDRFPAALLSPTGDLLGHLEGYHEPADLVACLSKPSNVSR
jgi:thiol:disulfide interchange protein